MENQCLPNFEMHWKGANVILRTQNSDGKELHANREELAENSSYFQAMFFSGFKEAYQDSVDVPCDFIYMHNILKTIHNSNTTGRLMGASTVTQLVEMYHIAHMLDFPNIRKMYTERIEELGVSVITVALAALELENHDIIVNSLKNMKTHELEMFLKIGNDSLLFCKNDIIWLYEKIANSQLVKEPVVSPRRQAMIYPELKVPNRFPAEKWFSTDVIISTRSSGGKLLFANKKVLSASSARFREMFSATNAVSIHVDVDFITMKVVLFILRDADWCSANVFHPVLLYSMFLFAMDFKSSVIMKFVSARLVKQATAGCFEVALKLNLDSSKPLFIERMLPSDLRNWVFSGDDDLVYTGGGEYVIISSKATDLNLSLNDLRLVLEKLVSEYAPKAAVGAKVN